MFPVCTACLSARAARMCRGCTSSRYRIRPRRPQDSPSAATRAQTPLSAQKRPASAEQEWEVPTEGSKPGDDVVLPPGSALLLHASPSPAFPCRHTVAVFETTRGSRAVRIELPPGTGFV